VPRSPEDPLVVSNTAIPEFDADWETWWVPVYVFTGKKEGPATVRGWLGGFGSRDEALEAGDAAKHGVIHLGRP
jgi:hypothetical protein